MIMDEKPKNKASFVKKLAKERKTVRKFKSRPVSTRDILDCISVAKEAPSGMNAQPWRYLLIQHETEKKRIREICENVEKAFHENVKGNLSTFLDEKRITWKKPFLENASVLVVVVSDKKCPYSTESTWLAIGYLLLALEEKNLATCTYTPSKLTELKKFLQERLRSRQKTSESIPSTFQIESILPIGYSEDPKPKEDRMDVQEIIQFI